MKSQLTFESQEKVKKKSQRKVREKSTKKSEKSQQKVNKKSVKSYVTMSHHVTVTPDYK
jgi:hypothetical protein